MRRDGGSEGDGPERVGVAQGVDAAPLPVGGVRPLVFREFIDRASECSSEGAISLRGVAEGGEARCGEVIEQPALHAVIERTHGGDAGGPLAGEQIACGSGKALDEASGDVAVGL